MRSVTLGPERPTSRPSSAYEALPFSRSAWMSCLSTASMPLSLPIFTHFRLLHVESKAYRATSPANLLHLSAISHELISDDLHRSCHRVLDRDGLRPHARVSGPGQSFTCPQG